MGTLRNRTPPGGTLGIADGARSGNVLRALDIEAQAARVCTADGVLERNRERARCAKVELAVIPPYGGGWAHAGLRRPRVDSLQAREALEAELADLA